MSSQRGEIIGKGHFSKVRLARCKSGGPYVAVKLVSKLVNADLHDHEVMMREVAILASVSHPHVIALKKAYTSPQSLILITTLGAARPARQRQPDPSATYVLERALRSCGRGADASDCRGGQGLPRE